MTACVPVPAGVAADPSLLIQAFDPVQRLVRLVRMDPTAYREASFLDDRLFTVSRETMLCDWDDLVAAIPARAPADARWIFHIGHVGSTLIARLLGELTLSVREPRSLRDLALAGPANRHADAEAITRLLSRRFKGAPPTVVKATSFVSEIAPELCPPGQRALFLYADPVRYICSILAGENSCKEAAASAPQRALRMAARAPIAADQPSLAHLAAAAWACEMTSLETAAEAMLDRSIYWADFDRMLGDMGGSLGQIAQHLGYSASPAAIAAITSGPLMSRYSKALEFEYSPTLRRELLDEAGRDYRSAIDGAVAMLHKVAREAPLLARALARALEK